MIVNSDNENKTLNYDIITRSASWLNNIYSKKDEKINLNDSQLNWQTEKNCKRDWFKIRYKFIYNEKCSKQASKLIKN